MKLLRIDSSPLKEMSTSRAIADSLQQHLETKGFTLSNHRDLFYDKQVTLGNQDRFTGYFTPEDQQSESQKEAVADSNELALEFAAADAYIIAAPMYNFGVTAPLKAYIDLISRNGISFNYTESGPVGLLEGKKAYVIVSTGGTPVGSEVDFVSKYLKTFLGFVGITDVEIIPADLTHTQKDEAINRAKNLIAGY
ncbi:FMN-dependent NADH-azoreductase [Nonlabens ponticola]|uniref:FMN dependent NADH:quinone oxidoreductase n=1 Tax=Nonlabens ponticola TaxID=2496866 RepID=A0A3S9MW01_9FLAO|nr:NAD(P)H-dependent oxidoreductase [Nonlabens ponticola]AZQ43293.1 FMN-dependent NADH-azoreductase [Nonlabens ponticola]